MKTSELKRPCAHVGCSALVVSGYCDKHRPRQSPRRVSAQWHNLYNRKRWKELRAVQMLKEPFCRECAKRGLRVHATDVDHIVPHRGDTRLFYDIHNLQSLCHGCHSAKTMSERSE